MTRKSTVTMYKVYILSIFNLKSVGNVSLKLKKQKVNN